MTLDASQPQNWQQHPQIGRTGVFHDTLGILVELAAGNDVQVDDRAVTWTAPGPPADPNETIPILRPDFLNDFLALGLDRSQPVFRPRRFKSSTPRERQSPKRPEPGTRTPRLNVGPPEMPRQTQPGEEERRRVADYVRLYGGLSDSPESEMWSFALADGMEPAKSTVHVETISAWIKLSVALGFVTDEIESLHRRRAFRQPRYLLPYIDEGPGEETQWQTVLGWFRVPTSGKSSEARVATEPPLPPGEPESAPHAPRTTERRPWARTNVQAVRSAGRFEYEAYFSSSFGEAFESWGERLDRTTFKEDAGKRIVDGATDAVLNILRTEYNQADADRHIDRVRGELIAFPRDLWLSGLEFATIEQVELEVESASDDLAAAFGTGLKTYRKYKSFKTHAVTSGIARMKRRMEQRCDIIYEGYLFPLVQTDQHQRIMLFMNELISTTSYHLEFYDILGGQPMRLFAHDLYSALVLQFAGTVVSGTFRPCGGCREIASILPVKSKVRRRKPRYNATFYCDECMGNGMARRHATARYRGNALPFRPSRMQ